MSHPTLDCTPESYSVEIEEHDEFLHSVHLCRNGERQFKLGHVHARPDADRLEFALSGLCEYLNTGGDPGKLRLWSDSLLAFTSQIVVGELVYFQATSHVSRVHALGDEKFLRVEPEFSEVMTAAELLTHLEKTEEAVDDEIIHPG